jgi:ABC-type multidrug transport system fused ATPase/permease subunit
VSDIYSSNLPLIEPFIAILGPFSVIIYFLLRFYRNSLRELKRLESKSISPLQSKVNETLDGIPTIAAFKREKDFAGSAHHLIDNSNKALYIRTSAEIWVTLRVELMTSLIVLAVAMLGDATKVMSVSGYGIALSYASIMTSVLNTLIKSSATLESEVRDYFLNIVNHMLMYSWL